MGGAYDDEAITEVNYYESAYESGAAVREVETQEKDRSAGGEDEKNTRPFQSEKESRVSEVAAGKAEKEPLAGGLAGGDFYTRMEGDIKKIFASYPAETELENAMEGSKFARISYGENKFYVFGVLRVEGKPRYICYGVPAKNGDTPPPSLKDCASYIPTESGGYWMTYQDASTGVSVVINNL